MRESVTIAAVQMPIVPDNLEANLSTASRLCAEIFRRQRVDLLVLPEDSAKGPMSPGMSQKAKSNSLWLSYFRDLAVRNKTYIVPGTFYENADDGTYNSAVLINDKGEIPLSYRKRNLFRSEKNYLSAGNNASCVQTRIGKIAIMICADMADEANYNELADQRAEITCCPSFWAHGQDYSSKAQAQSHVNITCGMIALRTKGVFVLANGAGVSKSMKNNLSFEAELVGQTQICDAVNRQRVLRSGNSEGFVIYTMDKPVSVSR